ncbi:T5orf172 domain-containing [Tenacibaculum phage pT24]|uniref:T5orf172 domain-containing n=1 Tax=Tenacibaculum phage pT24 TaxID=1880590 RepID=A0A1W7GKQ9_9CAUD|nr:T5orf172 domain-containing [Tenacibaculum phage pT24]BAX25563.1 T5orf172 domain-containing [Tenacibaculum phage pT24]
MKIGYIYLLEEYRNFERAFKIGFTTSTVEKRVKSMQTGNSDEIIIVDTFRTKHYLKVEKMLHNKFNQYGKRGEWFSMTDEMAMSFKQECENAVRVIEALSNNPFFNK